MAHDGCSESHLPSRNQAKQSVTAMAFPPIEKSHMLHCSYHYWHPLYRSSTPKARLIPLNQAFVDYLKADGIYLPKEDIPHGNVEEWTSTKNSTGSVGVNMQNDELYEDPSRSWQDIHASIKSTIDELGGKVAPKLNWSAPKDAIWINATNSMECRSPNDIYTLLKASEFITHDLDMLFKDWTAPNLGEAAPSIPCFLVLRKYVDFNPAVEFRCFIRRRQFLGACQRDPNYFEFLFPMRKLLLNKMQDFYHATLEDSFPDESFSFDVYMPAPHQRVWLIDINPWVIHTDPILFSWSELLTMRNPQVTAPVEENMEPNMTDSGITLVDSATRCDSPSLSSRTYMPAPAELRLVTSNHPQAYSFNTTRYSAQKLPKDVVDASQSDLDGLQEFADQWKEIFRQNNT